MTARMLATPIRVLAKYGNAEVRQRRLDADAELGIRVPDRNQVTAAASTRLWGSPVDPGYIKALAERNPEYRRIVVVGFTLGPIGQSGRIIGDGGRPFQLR